MKVKDFIDLLEYADSNLNVLFMASDNNKTSGAFLSMANLCAYLRDKYGVNVAEKTVYGWESNQAHPTSDVFVALCDIYKINNISFVISSNIYNAIKMYSFEFVAYTMTI